MSLPWTIVAVVLTVGVVAMVVLLWVAITREMIRGHRDSGHYPMIEDPKRPDPGHTLERNILEHRLTLAELREVDAAIYAAEQEERDQAEEVELFEWEH